MNEPALPNWFEMTAQANFERLLGPYKGRERFQALQIGAFAGHASEWLLRHVLTGTGAMLTDVDTWMGSDEEQHRQIDFTHVRDVYDRRVAEWKHTGKISTRWSASDKFFALEFALGRRLYDFVYIDGDHTEAQVYKDAVNAWLCTKPGSIIAFDDYAWGEGAPMHLRPKRAIDRLLSEWGDAVEVLEMGWQVWIRRLT